MTPFLRTLYDLSRMQGHTPTLWNVYVRRDNCWYTLMRVTPDEFEEATRCRRCCDPGIWTTANGATYIFPKLAPGEQLGRQYRDFPR